MGILGRYLESIKISVFKIDVHHLLSQKSAPLLQYPHRKEVGFQFSVTVEPSIAVEWVTME